MSSSPEMTAARAGIALIAAAFVFAAAPAHAGDAGTPASAPSYKGIVPEKILKVWKDEGTGNGALEKYKPATGVNHYRIGTVPTAEQIAGWTIAVPPDGANLPPGKGTPAEGEKIYSMDCAMCHGGFGEGANAYPALVGGIGSLASAAPQKTVGSYWPYATTLWDYINRAMPFFAPHTLKPDQVYALTAFILNMNDIVKSDFVADAKTVPQVKMPNRNSFNWKDPRPLTHNKACMKNCTSPSSVKITSNAATMGLTPRMTGPVDDMKNGK